MKSEISAEQVLRKYDEKSVEQCYKSCSLLDIWDSHSLDLQAYSLLLQKCSCCDLDTLQYAVVFILAYSDNL